MVATARSNFIVMASLSDLTSSITCTVDDVVEKLFQVSNL
jgi:hypothetical protein